MTPITLHIKNMVCHRCVMTVEDICRQLGIGNFQVALGTLNLSTPLTHEKRTELDQRLHEVGFELLKSSEQVTLEKLKTVIRTYARNYEDEKKYKLSSYIEDKLKIDYRYASRLFSTSEGRSIQSYLILQRIEYVKELLIDDQHTLAEIADMVGFSSVSHISTTFKKSQGITISEFRDNGERVAIDKV